MQTIVGDQQARVPAQMRRENIFFLVEGVGRQEVREEFSLAGWPMRVECFLCFQPARLKIIAEQQSGVFCAYALRVPPPRYAHLPHQCVVQLVRAVVLLFACLGWSFFCLFPSLPYCACDLPSSFTLVAGKKGVVSRVVFRADRLWRS